MKNFYTVFPCEYPIGISYFFIVHPFLLEHLNKMCMHGNVHMPGPSPAVYAHVCMCVCGHAHTHTLVWVYSASTSICEG